MKLTAGDLIEEKYRVIRVLGTGGMGAVYEALNLRVGRRVAIKVMHNALDPAAVARFEREARAAQIGSPYIVQVHDLGYLADGAPYMVMEYLSGESLGARLSRQRRLSPSELLPIAQQALEALGAAHRAGIVHRDLKPDNIFLARLDGESREVVKLVDFGISKVVGNALTQEPSSLTRTGVTVGTPHYMSPEQVQGAKSLDGRSDLYSLGVVLYRCLSGQLPYVADEVAALLVAILLEPPKPLRQVAPQVDRAMAAIVARAMSRNVDDRYPSASDFLKDLAIWEKTHAGESDEALDPSEIADANRPSLVGTAASWATSAESSRAIRRKALLRWLTVAAFSCAGFVLLLAITRLLAPASREPIVATSTASGPSAVTVPAEASSVAIAASASPAESPSAIPRATSTVAVASTAATTGARSLRGAAAPAVSKTPVPGAASASASSVKVGKRGSEQSGRHLLDTL